MDNMLRNRLVWATNDSRIECQRKMHRTYKTIGEAEQLNKRTHAIVVEEDT